MRHIFKITPPKNIKDKEVLKQIPDDIKDQLGEQEETGYDLVYSRRDIFFEHGTVKYNPYKPMVTVEFSEDEQAIE